MASDEDFLESYNKVKESYSNIIKLIDQALEFEEQETLKDAIACYEKAYKEIDILFKTPIQLPDNYLAVKPEWNDACEMIQMLKAARTEIIYRLEVLKNRSSASNVEFAREAKERMLGEYDEAGPSTRKKNTMYNIDDGKGTTRTYRQLVADLRAIIASRESGVKFDTLFESDVKLYKILPNGAVAALAGETPMSVVMCTVSGPYSYLSGLNFIQCAIPMPNQNFQDKTQSRPLESEATGTATATTAATTGTREGERRGERREDEGEGEAEWEAQDVRNMVWVYPLIPLVTSCYRTEYGAFIFPDLESTQPGGAFGLMLSNESKFYSENDFADVSQFFVDLLEALLREPITVLVDPSHVHDRQLQNASQKVSKQIVVIADCISKNLVKSAEKTGEFMIRATPHIISKMQSAGDDPVPVPSAVQTSVEVAQKVTRVAAGVTGWVAGKIGAASMAVGHYLAPHIQHHGAVLLEKGLGYNRHEAHSKMEGALTIAAGAIEGFSTVYSGLETSARILGSSLSDNSIKIIEHKYGPSAGNIAANTFESVGNAFNVSQNVNYINPRGFAKKMAKTTGRAVVEDYQKSLRRPNNTIPAGSIYKDLRTLKEK